MGVALLRLDWAFCIPRAARDAVFKKRNGKWTPTAYAVRGGDVFYSRSYAYELPWGKAVKRGFRIVQVQEALPGPSGTVRIEVYKVKGAKRLTKTINTTQRGLVRMLRTGKFNGTE